jgi:hypothetical protein
MRSEARGKIAEVKFYVTRMFRVEFCNLTC